MKTRYKAWIARSKYGDYSTVVFAETRGRAKTVAMTTDCCEDADFVDITCHRCPVADSQYEGRAEMDWNNPKDRLFLVKHLGWHCEEASLDDCLNCVARDYCDYKEKIAHDN